MTDGNDFKGGPAGVRSFSWGNREIRIVEDRITLYVEGVAYDTAPILEEIRKAGARPERLSPARWISLLRGKATALPGCGKTLMLARTPSGYTLKCLETVAGREASLQAEMQ